MNQQWIETKNALDYFPDITKIQSQKLINQILSVKPIHYCQSTEQCILLSIIYYSIEYKIINNLFILLDAIQQYEQKIQATQSTKSILQSFSAGLKNIIEYMKTKKVIIVEESIQYFLDNRIMNQLFNIYKFIESKDNNQFYSICKLFSIRLVIHRFMNNDKLEISSYQSLKKDFQIDIMCFSSRYFLVKPNQNYLNQQLQSLNSPQNHSNQVNSPSIRNPTIQKTILNIASTQNQKLSSFSNEINRSQQAQPQYPNQPIQQGIQQRQDNLGRILDNNYQNNTSNQFQNIQQSNQQQYSLSQQYSIQNSSPQKQYYQQQQNQQTNQICQLCKITYSNPKDLFINQPCGHGICKYCIPQLNYPDRNQMKCYRNGCTYFIRISDIDNFIHQDRYREMQNSVKKYQMECSYCLKKTEIELDRIPEYYKCSNCNNINCYLHNNKLTKMENCFCKCMKCLNETKQIGKMKVCQKCKIAKCICCNKIYSQLINCECGCFLCNRSLSVLPDGKLEICLCSKQVCSFCLVSLDYNTISDKSISCSHNMCHPCFVYSQIDQNKIKCTLCTIC